MRVLCCSLLRWEMFLLCLCLCSVILRPSPLLSLSLSLSLSPAGEPAARARSHQHHPSSAPVCSLLIPRRRQTRARDETRDSLNVNSIPLPLSLCVPPCSCARCRPVISSSLSSCSVASPPPIGPRAPQDLWLQSAMSPAGALGAGPRLLPRTLLVGSRREETLTAPFLPLLTLVLRASRPGRRGQHEGGEEQRLSSSWPPPRLIARATRRDPGGIGERYVALFSLLLLAPRSHLSCRPVYNYLSTIILPRREITSSDRPMRAF
jgi:hypothetical protein